MHSIRAVQVAGVATVVIAATLLVTASTSASASTASPGGVERHFVLVDHSGPTSFDDIDPAGISVGDTFAFSETVSDHGNVVGTAGGVCVEIAVRATSTSQQCTLTAVLREGQLVATGIATYRSTADPRPVHYAITGGTGAYRTARGQVRVTPIKTNSDRIDLDVITS